MVSIRLQRTGRKKHAQFRVVVQDSRRAPTSGRVIANLGYYNPHTKEHNLDLEKVNHYLKQGAQPSSRVIYILKANKVALPKWVKESAPNKSKLKHPDKLRKNRSDKPMKSDTNDDSEVSEQAVESEESVSEEPPQEATLVTDKEPVVDAQDDATEVVDASDSNSKTE